VAKRISNDVLRRHLAGESLRSLAPDVGLSHVGLGKRLRSAPIKKRLLVLEAGPELPAEAQPEASKGNQPRPATTLVDDEPVTRVGFGRRDRSEGPIRVTLRKGDRTWIVNEGSEDETYWRSRGFA
jgi:hypothetical protein